MRMREADLNEGRESLITRLRAQYLTGKSIPNIIRNEASFEDSTPVDVMFVLMEAFHVGLSDVSCIDGWWPPNATSEVTDENLDLFIRDAIKAHQAQWDIR